LRERRRFRALTSIRTRILAIALIPSLALLIICVLVAGSLVLRGNESADWAAELRSQSSAGAEFTSSFQQERLHTLLQLAGDEDSRRVLPAKRQQVDTAFATLTAAATVIGKLGSDAVGQQIDRLTELAGELPSVRRRVDTATIGIEDAYHYYNQVIDAIMSIMDQSVRRAHDPGAAVDQSMASGLFRAAEALSRGHALAAAASRTGGLDPGRLREFSDQVGYVHNEINRLTPTLGPEATQQLQHLTSSQPWQTLSTVETSLLGHGSLTIRDTATTTRSKEPRADSDPIALPDWEAALSSAENAIFDLWQTQQKLTLEQAVDAGAETAHQSLLAGIGVVILTVVAFLIALVLANQLTTRLKRLRAETLTLADEQLPEIMDRLSNGEPVDPSTDLLRLDYGKDEIGQVADAFNRAQSAAVAAAANEARTREGVDSVFLNIAHRSQVVMHRQLELLYNAEHEQEDPHILDLLFRLDHLATRERRNAENLIILGGEQPRRRWRNPVPLVDIVRSAVAETQYYARVHIVRLHAVHVVGTVVADIVHLLAELVDNATSYSPPDSRVEISGNIVGKGIAVEITDRGLGMTAEQLARMNETLSGPADFALASLTGDSRLGTFVVARLASQHDIRVRLVESEYGGIRAIVLIPSALLADIDDHIDPPAPLMPGRTDRLLHNGIRPEGRREHGHPIGVLTPAPSTPVTEKATAPLSDPAAEDRHAPESEQQQPALDPDGPPPLPRRRRQQHLAPQLAVEPQPTAPPAPRQPDQQSAEQARDLFSAIAIGTRQGRRQSPPDQQPPPENDEWTEP
jgi:hypothetical protein